jgi:hypothetical protein
MNDERTFSLTLPREPFSFSGKLISLVWALELIVEPARTWSARNSCCRRPARRSFSVKARENPFASDPRHRDDRYTCPDGGIETLIARLAALGYRAAIVGPHGCRQDDPARGPRAGAAGARIPLSGPCVSPRTIAAVPADWPSHASLLGPRDIVCLDGCGAAVGNPVALVSLARTARGRLDRHVAREGRLPLLIECTTSADLLEGIVRRLSPAPAAGAPSSADLFRRHQGNLRDALRELYDFPRNCAPLSARSFVTPAGYTACR